MSALVGKLREVTGKSAIRKLRNEEAMPAVMYGLNDNLKLVVNPKELKKLLLEKGRNALIELNIEGDSSRNVVLKEYQAHPLESGWLHVDFLEVDITKKIKVKVPVYLVGTSPAEKMGAILNHVLRHLEIESIPKNIPEKIEVPMGDLELNQMLHVSDLVVEGNLEILTPLTDVVVTAYEEKVKEDETKDEEGEEATTVASEDADAKKEDG